MEESQSQHKGSSRREERIRRSYTHIYLKNSNKNHNGIEKNLLPK